MMYGMILKMIKKKTENDTDSEENLGTKTTRKKSPADKKEG